MDIGTIVAGLQAIASLFNQPVQLTPAQAEEKKKKQPPMNTIIFLPNQTPPMGVGVPLAELLVPMSYPPMYNPSSNMTFPSSNPNPSLRELYELYYGIK